MLSKLIRRKTDSHSLSRRGDRKNVFQIRRFKNDHGFYVYALENVAEAKKIFIPRFVFGKFRACVREILESEIKKAEHLPFERSVDFLNRQYFYFKSSRMDLDNLIIQDIEERTGSSGYITASRRCLKDLDALLYDEELAHPNDVLDSIISYHKLFQFSFVKGSKSITSELALRKDVLQAVVNYRPNLAERVVNSSAANPQADIATQPSRSSPSAASKRTPSDENFQSKLGERFHEKNIRVDYSEIFSDKKVLLGKADDPHDGAKRKTKSGQLQFGIPLSAVEVKAFSQPRFSIELSAQSAADFRQDFIGERSSDYFLGFEIVDSLFTHNKVLKSFQFPLYYMRVRLRESGRGLHIESTEDGRIYFNHLALAQLVERFAKKAAGVDVIDDFFSTLLAQHISVDQLNDRITLTRHLPLSEQIFDRTREVLFGYADENGKGGILGDLKLNGVECDLHAVNLYRAPSLLAPLDQALEHDLDSIYAIAHQQMPRFYDSLLGRFLTPELSSGGAEQAVDPDLAWVPGRLPKSTRRLFDRLAHHDLVLLEGPPGTGKTHTILNLLIHYVCTQQRVLIVSDQRGAIEALVEKLEQYLSGKWLGANALNSGAPRNLLFHALKIIDDVDISSQNLSEIVDKLALAFKTQEAGADSARKSIEKKLNVLSADIDALTRNITQSVNAHMGDDQGFESTEPRKLEFDTDLTSLTEFLALLLDENNPRRKLLIAFIEQRRTLIKEGLAPLYAYFNLPVLAHGAEHLEDEMQGLEDDRALLASLKVSNIETKDELLGALGAYPRHELVRYLESSFEAEMENSGGGLKRVAKKITPGYQSPLQKNAAMLYDMVTMQLALLGSLEAFSGGLWRLLRDLHDNIQLNDRPNQALALYFRLTKISDSSCAETFPAIQGELEKIAELYRQRDSLVYEQFVGCLQAITHRAATQASGNATDRITRIMSLVEDLKQFNSIAESGDVFEEFKLALLDAFPIWIVRKQVVPFLLPCVEKSFDLVIIDEATQCRVDDAMSLLFRAKKLLVVGDDKQTVLQKNSSLDDYLFKDHELDEHLRSTQARGFKGGGSHIFGLVKSIKQASVMLDEHYRCPAQIIEFSNHYVYGDQLKVMQWRLPDQPSPVVVDDSEFHVDSAKKATSGKFKGIETEMVDRFFDYVLKTLREIEREQGVKINVETDVALCYFLMKNEVYVKHVKDTFLSRLKRGETVLDGAGAALQGKERDYIFYLWDITRYNLAAFTQGDDEDKRKGELNVLMSRPKKKAFHFLHRNFAQLDHSRSTISHYLWRTLLRQRQSGDLEQTRIEGEQSSLFLHLLKLAFAQSSQRGTKEARYRIENEAFDFRPDISVGDPNRAVDLLAIAKDSAKTPLGLVNLAGFNAGASAGDDVVDYYFQLKRAVPNIDPVFIFPYELLMDHGEAFRLLTRKFSTA